MGLRLRERNGQLVTRAHDSSSRDGKNHLRVALALIHIQSVYSITGSV